MGHILGPGNNFLMLQANEENVSVTYLTLTVLSLTTFYQWGTQWTWEEKQLARDSSLQISTELSNYQNIDMSKINQKNVSRFLLKFFNATICDVLCMETSDFYLLKLE